MQEIAKLFLLPVLIAGLGLMPASLVTGQTFNVLHTFTSTSGPNAINSDGANPSGSLILSGCILYGTAIYGGSSGWGTVFAVSTNGTGFTTPYNFTGGNDGANPSGGVLLSNNTLYGTASGGGSLGAGTVFAVNAMGAGFTNLHSFTVPVNDSFGFYTNRDGAHPQTSLLLSGNILYGAANNGGTSGLGTLFAVGVNGSGFTTVHSFSSGTGGGYSSAGVILSSETLYGTDYANLGNGTIFAVKTNGAAFTNNYAFTSGHLDGSGILTNSDGANPHANLILLGDILYGTTERGGAYGHGALFAVNTNGSGFTTLHSFAAGGYNPFGLFTNSDGAGPSAGLVLGNNTLYGTANAGGSSGNGTVFALNTDGTGFTNLHSFSATPPYPQIQTNSDGANPPSGLTLSGNTLFGTTAYGGSSGNGAVFSLSFAPQLTIISSGTNVVLSWPSNFAGFDYTGFTLQSAPALTATFTNIQGATSPYNNPSADAQRFYRLSR